MKRILVIIIGIIIICIGGLFFGNVRKLTKVYTVEAAGTIIDVVPEERTEEKDGIIKSVFTYYPVVEYTVKNVTYSGQSVHGSETSKYKVDEPVRVLYNPDNIEEYIIKGDISYNFFGVLCIIIGVIMILVGVIKNLNKINEKLNKKNQYFLKRVIK